MFFTLFVEHLFIMYIAVATSSAQYSFEKCLDDNMTVHHFHDGFVFSFYDTILLWCIPRSKFLVDAMKFTKVLKFS
jgi:hypothetical protein